MNEIDAAAWDACANPQTLRDEPSICLAPRPTVPEPATEAALEDIDTALQIAPELQKERFNPFVTHAFLHALERSGSATSKTGWAGAHVLVEDDGELIAAAPTYLKSHSMGEYVFDYGWADAYERAGGRYYPKLLVGVPFTPAPGRRLLVKGGDKADQAQQWLLAGLRAVRQQTGASSIHVNFPTLAEWEWLGQAGFLQRVNKQFHFFNRGYAGFEDFLAALASRKRKQIRRERKDALAAGIEIEWVTGADLGEKHWDAFFDFYTDTGSRKWGRPYLTRKFFSLLGETMPDRVLLILAKRAGHYIAGAINLIGDDALYGRNWGCIEEHPFLHFEVCYYQAIDFALARGLSRVEAGAQGEHKLARGYGPVPTYSAHEISDKRLARAIADYLARERVEIDETIEEYAEHVPFKKG